MDTPVKLLMDEDKKVKVTTPFSSKLFSHYFNSAHFPKLLWGGGQPKTFKCKGSLKGNTFCFNGIDKRSETDKIREADKGKKIRTLQKVKTVKQV